jgi:hypothetical protein
MTEVEKKIMEVFFEQWDKESNGWTLKPKYGAMSMPATLKAISTLIQEERQGAVEDYVEKIKLMTPRYLKGGTQVNQYFVKGWNEFREEVINLKSLEDRKDKDGK